MRPWCCSKRWWKSCAARPVPSPRATGQPQPGEREPRQHSAPRFINLPTLSLRRPGSLRLVRQLHREVKSRAFAQLAFHTDRAIHHLDQPPADGQAEPGTTIFARDRTVRLHKRREQLLARVRIDADTGVAHLETQ